MRRIIFAILFSSITPASAQAVSERDKFELWGGCRTMGLHVVLQVSDAASELHLTEETVRRGG